jgi:hypothetical protein
MAAAVRPPSTLPPAKRVEPAPVSFWHDGDPDMEKEERSRLFQHVLHEESSFTQRNSYFLVAQSLMLVAYSALHDDASAPIIVTLFGLSVSLIWLYIGRSHFRYLRHVSQRCIDKVPDFAKTETERPHRSISARWIIGHAVPFLSCLLWALMFAVSISMM